MDSSSRILKLALLADTANFSRGLDGASKQTKTFGQKTADVAKRVGKAFAIAGVAVAGMAAKLAIDGVKAAIADEKAQVKLATTLKNTTKASTGQIKSVEKYIDKLQRATGVADDKLRPSLEKLLVATGKVGKAQKLQALAMDIAQGTGKDLETVSLSLAKAYGGNLGALTRMGITLDESIIKNKDFKAAQEELDRLFGGQSAAAADTMEGKFKRFNVAMDEAKESIGVALMPALTEMIDYLNSEKGQKVVTEFAEAFAEAIKMMAKYLPGVVREVSKLVKKVGQQGLIAGLLSDPKIAVAAAAWGAGAIAGGPAGGAVAAIAAYAAAEGISKVQTGVENNLKMGLNPTVGQITGVNPKKKKYLTTPPPNPFDYLGNDLAYQEALSTWKEGEAAAKGKGGGGSSKTPKFKMPSSRLTPTINIVVNGAADSRESARAIERTLNKIYLNGGSQAGILGFN